MRGTTTTVCKFPILPLGGTVRGPRSDLVHLGEVTESMVDAANRRLEKAASLAAEQDDQARLSAERDRAIQTAILAAERSERVRQEIQSAADVSGRQMLQQTGYVAGLAILVWGAVSIFASLGKSKSKGGGRGRSKTKRRRRKALTIQAYERSSSPVRPAGGPAL